MSKFPSTWLLLLLGWSTLAICHEVRPAYLQFQELEPEQFAVLWKQPVLDNRRLPLTPVLPEACEPLSNISPERAPAALLERWSVECDLRSGKVHISGLTRTLTDVLVSIDYLTGEDRRFVLKPDNPTQDLSDETPGIWSYLVIGIEHLLFGIDHILFVVGLVLYIQGAVPLLKTITAFTVAHSITLALSVLGVATLPQAPVEAVIALSIVFLARELMLPVEQRSALTSSRPWIMAFLFGLLHGFGFAGALADIGLPREQLAIALLLFNVGIEIGQLLVVAVMLILGFLLQRIMPTTPITAMANRQFGWPQATPVTWAMALMLGAVASYWTIDRVLLII
ncbi:MAG: HupE/UreJ family protein [Pseudomonadales bacterium]